MKLARIFPCMIILLFTIYIVTYVLLPSQERLQYPTNYYNGTILVKEDVNEAVKEFVKEAVKEAVKGYVKIELKEEVKQDVNEEVKGKLSVELIDRIGIGIYTWLHLLNGSLDVSDRSKQIYRSNKTIDGILFKYKLKCCYPTPPANFTIDNDDKNVILAIWGRSGSGKMIRKAINDPSIRNLALLIFSEANCQDNYLEEALRSDKLRFVYMTHESKMIDEKRVFLWPLGTQMTVKHRVRHDSPFIKPIEPVDVDSTRKFTSTFIGKLVLRPSRQRLVDTVKKNKQLFDNNQQLISFAPRWSEQKEQLVGSGVGDVYEYSLRNSELTLSPAGTAAECYRTFEALELGSIPIISNHVQKSCYIKHEHNETIQSPYRIFKLDDAPVYYVNDWSSDLPKIMQEFEQLSAAQKREKRRKVHDWYNSFKVKLRRKLVNDVKRFFV